MRGLLADLTKVAVASVIFLAGHTEAQGVIVPRYQTTACVDKSNMDACKFTEVEGRTIKTVKGTCKTVSGLKFCAPSQKIDWKGEDGGLYVLLSESGGGVRLTVRLTAPLADEFPDRQLITGFAITYEDGHSVVVENRNPYTTETQGCPDAIGGLCLSEHALKITVDGEELLDVAADRTALPGGAAMTAVNLPAECQPYGGDVIWAESFSEIATPRRSLLAFQDSVDVWVSRWSETTAAPTWCAKFLAESGPEGLLRYQSKHSAFQIDTPSLRLRVNHGTNHQGGEVLDDGRFLPHLEFWQIDLVLESHNLNADTVTGILGETMRPMLDTEGQPIMSGLDALRGEVEDYRVSGPLETDFTGCHEEGSHCDPAYVAGSA